MKMDMDLIREILMKIELEHKYSALYNIEIEGYDKTSIVYHCKLLYQANMIDQYESLPCEDDIYSFGVGALTWEGNDFLNKIRDNSIWNKTKKVIINKALPITVGSIKQIATSIISTTTQVIVKGILDGTIIP